MKKQHEDKLEEVKRVISEAIDPRRMSVSEAREFLEELVEDLGMQIDLLEED